MTYEMTYLGFGSWYAECTNCDWSVQLDSVAKAHEAAVKHRKAVHL